MENITETFSDVYLPEKGLAIYKNADSDREKYYIESFDFSLSGRPINFHPLSDKESLALAETLYPDSKNGGFLHCEGLLPKNVLYVNTSYHGYVLWYTPAARRHLLFKENLGIPSGVAHVPPLVWFATKNDLYVSAFKENRRPKPSTALFRAPFFNVADDGAVCMGDVLVNFSEDCSLQEFIKNWEKYFFGSYFTHLNVNDSPVKGNIVQLWKNLVETGSKFPFDWLVEGDQRIKNYLDERANN